jgi:hypothetical protein
MDKIKEKELKELLGTFNYQRIYEITNKSAMDMFLEISTNELPMKRKKGAEFACCFVLKDVKLTNNKKVDVFVHEKFKVLSRTKFQQIFAEMLLEEFSIEDSQISDFIKKFNLEHDNKVFYIHNNIC